MKNLMICLLIGISSVGCIKAQLLPDLPDCPEEKIQQCKSYPTIPDDFELILKAGKVVKANKSGRLFLFHYLEAQKQ